MALLEVVGGDTSGDKMGAKSPMTQNIRQAGGKVGGAGILDDNKDVSWVAGEHYRTDGLALIACTQPSPAFTARWIASMATAVCNAEAPGLHSSLLPSSAAARLS